MALADSSVLGSIMRAPEPAGIAIVVAVAIVLRGMAAVNSPRIAAWNRAGMMARF